MAWYGGGRRDIAVVSGTGQWYRAGEALVAVRWVYVEDRAGTHGENHVARGGPRHGRGDHLVARADACRQQREVEARGAGRDGYGVGCADSACESFLEAADARAAGEPARAQAGGDLFDLFRPDRRA